MRQFIGSVGGPTTVRDFLLGLAPEPIRAAGTTLVAAERELAARPDDATSPSHMRRRWPTGRHAGGYDAEVVWNLSCESSIGLPFDAVATVSWPR